jgi:hypothetical protein
MTPGAKEAARLWRDTLSALAVHLAEVPDLPPEVALAAREVVKAAEHGDGGRNARRAAERRLARELARCVSQYDHTRLPPRNRRSLPLPPRPANVVRLRPPPPGPPRGGVP